MPKDKVAAGSPSLCRSIGFSDLDLRMNERGEMSSAQAARLRHKLLQPGWAIYGCYVFATLAILEAFVAFFDDRVEALGESTSLFGLLAFICLCIAYLHLPELVTDLDSPIHSVESTVHLRIDGKGIFTRYIVTSLNVEFSVTQRVFLAFKQGEIYSIYYVPKSKTILSVNALSHVQ